MVCARSDAEVAARLAKKASGKVLPDEHGCKVRFLIVPGGRGDAFTGRVEGGQVHWTRLRAEGGGITPQARGKTTPARFLVLLAKR